MPEKNDIHKGHRQRMTDRYLKYGIEVFDEQELLEMLLYFCYTRVDTSGMAKALLEYFGSLKELAAASYEEILQTGIIGGRAAAALCYIKDCAGILLCGGDSGKLLSDARTLKNYCIGILGDKEVEIAYVLLLDDAMTLIKGFELARGALCHVSYDLRLIADMAVKSQCRKIVIVHNHPDGIVLASSVDVAATRRSFSVLRDIGIELVDHIIVSKAHAFSMRQSSFLTDLWS